MYHSAAAHYKNKYPGGQVFSLETSIDVYDREGIHVVALRRDGTGRWVCASEQQGCRDRHCLSPLPKDARVWKYTKEGNIAPSEEYRSRSKINWELCEHEVGGSGKVPSIQELHCYLNPDGDKNSGFDSHWKWADKRPTREQVAEISEASKNAVAEAAKNSREPSRGMAAFFGSLRPQLT